MRRRRPRSSRSTIQGLQSRRVLLVEECSTRRAQLVADVSAREFLAEPAASSGEALDLLGQRTYPIVVLGRLDGEADYKRLWQELGSCHPETLVVSASGALEETTGDPEQLDKLVASLGNDWEADALAESLQRAVRLFSARHSQAAPAPPKGDLEQLLLVEDLDSDAFLIEGQLRAHLPRCKVTRAITLTDALARLEDGTFDMILSDLALADACGLDAVLRLQTVAAETPLVVISAVVDDALALQAVQAGAQDVISKDHLRGAALVRSLRYAEQRKRSEVRLQKLANFDPLTGLANRAQFVKRLGETLARARRRGDGFAVMYIDLDGFKAVNDTRGHDAGDAVLTQVGHRLEAGVRDSDLIARLGGDEFAAIMDNLPSPVEAQQTCERLLESLRRSYGPGAASQVTASIGIAFYPEAAHTVADLLKAADHAMYEAKRRGRNTYEVYTATALPPVQPEAMLSQELKRALSRDEFCLHYQPQVARDGGLCSAEALLRWRRGGARMLPPAEFLPLLEASSDIVDVGLWVVRTACEDFIRWRRAGLSLGHVAVNVSARQLEDPGFVKEVEGILRETGVDPRCLELEVTESTVMRQPDRAATVLHELRDLGVRLAMDDFGTGHSSLAHLYRMPFDTVKIDRSFVSDLLEDAKGRAVTRAILSLARDLQLRTVGEGVEVEAQRRWLLDEGCEVFQGYLVGVPTAANLIEHALTVPARGEPRTIPVTSPPPTMAHSGVPDTGVWRPSGRRSA